MSAPQNLAAARAQVVLDRPVSQDGDLWIGCDRTARKLWREVGLSLRQRDAAIDRLVNQGWASLRTDADGVWLCRGRAGQ